MLILSMRSPSSGLGLYDEPSRFDVAVNAVQAGQADAIMAGMTITEARFPKSYFFQIPTMTPKLSLHSCRPESHRLQRAKRKDSLELKTEHFKLS